MDTSSTLHAEVPIPNHDHSPSYLDLGVCYSFQARDRIKLVAISFHTIPDAQS
jgi:hypothetical protein